MANRFYLDASAIAKRYVPERGEALIHHLFARLPRHRLVCLGIGTLEVLSVFVRKKNANRLPLPVYSQALIDFRTEVLDAADFAKLSVPDQLVTAAMPLVPKHSINANDALLLRSALDLAAQLRVAGDELVLVASDQRLLNAAQAEALVTFNPETQSQADLDALIGP
jgi:uncharacterized protein